MNVQTSPEATGAEDQVADNVTSVQFECSTDFPEILRHLKASVAITTYQAGKLVVVGVEDDGIKFSFHNADQPMGLAVSSEAIALAACPDTDVDLDIIGEIV